MQFGGSGIVSECFEWIRSNIPDGSTILELGSGHVSTQYLCPHYTMFSVEQYESFLNLYDSTYIHAEKRDYGEPTGKWFDVQVMREELPKVPPYQLLLIDGPCGENNRRGFLTYMGLFDTDNCILLFDDTDRAGERSLADAVQNVLGRPMIDHNHFCIIEPKEKSNG